MSRKLELEKGIARMQKELDDLPKLKKPGLWYGLNGTKALYYVVRNDDDSNLVGYGFNYLGEWVLEGDFCTSKELKEDHYVATQSEVRSRLIDEAKRRGFIKGTQFKSAYNDSEFIFEDYGGFSISEKNNFTSSKSGSFFYKGKWAEIIKEPTIILHGYEIEIDDTHVKFGCKHFPINTIKSLDISMRECNATKIDIDDYRITRREIQDVVRLINNYKNK